MSKRHRQAANEAHAGQGLWVSTEVMPADGSYAVTISIDGDRSFVLDREGAQRYATTAVAAAQRAEYDAAIFKLITRTLGLDSEHAAHFLGRDVRPDRVPLDDATTGPLSFVPGVNSAGRPFIDAHVDGQPWGQIDVEALRVHAMAVLEAPHAADLDAGLVQALLKIGIDEPRARAAVADIAKWRP